MIFFGLVISALQFLCIPCYSYVKESDHHTQYLTLSSSQINKDGVDAFFNTQYEKGLGEFNKVLDAYYRGKASETDYGLALWGRMLCHAALDNLPDFYDDVKAVEWFFLDQHGCSCSDSIASKNLKSLNTSLIISYANYRSDWFDRPVGQKAPEIPPQFADPYEKITKYECIERVKGTAKALRAAAAAIKRREVVWILNTLIDGIQTAGINCCEAGTFWATCVSPIIMKLNQWKIFGVPDDPSWD